MKLKRLMLALLVASVTIAAQHVAAQTPTTGNVDEDNTLSGSEPAKSMFEN